MADGELVAVRFRFVTWLIVIAPTVILAGAVGFAVLWWTRERPHRAVHDDLSGAVERSRKATVGLADALGRFDIRARDGKSGTADR